jgi:tyrosinase
MHHFYNGFHPSPQSWMRFMVNDKSSDEGSRALKSMPFSRRTFGTFAGAAVVSVLSAQSTMAQQEQPLRTRSSHDTEDGKKALTDYAAAVKLMKALPATDRRNWSNQAQIHQDFCPHGNWFFLPWHRAYLFYFEQACASVLNKPTFALPYWNWSKFPSIPDPFWEANSSLLHQPRSIAKGGKLDDRSTGQATIDRIQAIANFTEYGSAEATRLRPPVRGSGLELPHNSVHGQIGGTMGSFLSPLDPIFWLHHAYIDLLWSKWQTKFPTGLPRTSTWLNLRYTFPNPKTGSGTPASVSTSARGVVDYQRQLGYKYDYPVPVLSVGTTNFRLRDTLFVNVPDADEIVEGKLDSASGELSKADSVAAFSIPAVKQRLKVARSVQRVMGASNLGFPETDQFVDDASLRLVFEKIEVDPSTNLSYEVYLNPKGNDKPAADDPGYVGTIAFFGLDHGGTGHGQRNRLVEYSTSFNLNEVLAALQKANRYKSGDELKVKLFTVNLTSEKDRGKAVFGDIQFETVERGND